METPIAFLTYLYLDNVFDKVTPTHKNLSMKNDLITYKELSILMYQVFNKRLSWIKQQLFLESKSYHRSRKNEKTDFMAIFLIVVAFYRLPRGCQKDPGSNPSKVVLLPIGADELQPKKLQGFLKYCLVGEE